MRESEKQNPGGFCFLRKMQPSSFLRQCGSIKDISLMTGAGNNGNGQADFRFDGGICAGKDVKLFEETVMNEMQLEHIVSAYGKDILRFCRMTAGNAQEGDDLYQDTMLILLEKVNRLDPVENIKSYALSVSIRLWKNRKRKFARRLRLVPQESLEELAEQGIQPGEEDASPEEILIRQSQIRLVRWLVEQLPEKYRLPIQLYYSADLTVGAIAQVLKLPENTVKSRLRRGKEKIRTSLEEMEYEGSAI